MEAVHLGNLLQTQAPRRAVTHTLRALGEGSEQPHLLAPEASGCRGHMMETLLFLDPEFT